MGYFHVEFVSQTFVVDQIHDGSYKTQSYRKEVQYPQPYLAQYKPVQPGEPEKAQKSKDQYHLAVLPSRPIYLGKHMGLIIIHVLQDPLYVPQFHSLQFWKMF